MNNPTTKTIYVRNNINTYKHKPGFVHSLPEVYCCCQSVTGDWELDLTHMVSLDLILTDWKLERKYKKNKIVEKYIFSYDMLFG